MAEMFKNTEVKKEQVNHPKHYNRDDAMECFDEMVLIFGKEAVKNFCVINAWKYRYRAADKNGLEDLKKSDWYLKKYKELDESIIVTTKPSFGFFGNAVPVVQSVGSDASDA